MCVTWCLRACSYRWGYTLPMSLYTYKEMRQLSAAANIKHIFRPKRYREWVCQTCKHTISKPGSAVLLQQHSTDRSNLRGLWHHLSKREMCKIYPLPAIEFKQQMWGKQTSLLWKVACHKEESCSTEKLTPSVYTWWLVEKHNSPADIYSCINYWLTSGFWIFVSVTSSEIT